MGIYVRFKHCKQEKVHIFGIFFPPSSLEYKEKNLNICPGHPKRIFTQAQRGREEIFLSSASSLNFFCFGPAKIPLWRLNSAAVAAAALDYDTCKLCLSDESGLMSAALVIHGELRGASHGRRCSLSLLNQTLLRVKITFSFRYCSKKLNT